MLNAIVTGGTKGIGLGVVDMLIERGYHVFVSYAHDEAAAAMLAQRHGDRVSVFKADHSRREETYAFIRFVESKADEIHCVVCNAGVTRRTSFTDMKDEDWDAMMEVAVNGHVILLRELFDRIVDGGRVIFTGSEMALHPHATVLGYGVVKSAVHALVKNLVKVFEPKQVTVNAIAPGFVETEWQKEKPAEIRQNICQKTAIHRFASIEEVVGAYAFCLDNSFLNGSIIEVSGGYSYR